MEKLLISKVYGPLTYKENAWTGKKSLSLHGLPIKEIKKNTFCFDLNDHHIILQILGNFFSGERLVVGAESFPLSPRIEWYQYVLAFLPFFFDIVWGNIPSLFAILPLLGGFIGGFLTTIFGGLYLLLSKKISDPFYKVLLGFGNLLLSLGLCVLFGFLLTKL